MKEPRSTHQDDQIDGGPTNLGGVWMRKEGKGVSSERAPDRERKVIHQGRWSTSAGAAAGPETEQSGTGVVTGREGVAMSNVGGGG